MPGRGLRARGLRARLLCVAVFAIGSGGAIAHAADAPMPARGYSLYGDPGSPDLSGVWSGSFTAAPGQRAQTPIGDHKYTRWAPWPIPYTPAYRKMADDKIKSAIAGRVMNDPGVRCLPYGMPWGVIMNVGLPDEIIQTPGQVSIWVSMRTPLIIWTDGRSHPKDLKPSVDGHSIGYWVGDTLFVDTVGISDATPIDGQFGPHSAALHMVWTLRRVSPDRVHAHVTLIDQEALKEPLVTTTIFEQETDPAWDFIGDDTCFENNRNKPDEHGVSGFQGF